MNRSRVVKSLVGVALVIGVLAVGAVALLRSGWAARYVQQQAILLLEERMKASVELESIQLALFPRISVSGTGLRLTRRDADDEPFVAIREFHIAGSPWQLWQRRVSSIELEGLRFRILRGRGQTSTSQPGGRDVRVDRITVRESQLLIVPADPRKVPLEFSLHEVTMTDFGFDRSSPFSAQLTNPKPTALIQSEGHIGPWNTDEIGSTPLSGVYLMANGDLGSIKGIGGKIESSGKYEGVLERIRVEGTTKTPDFHLDLAQHPIRLDTTYRATVDGTSGDTYLEQVDATLGESKLVARGSITSIPDVKGRSISLQVNATDARFEDFLYLSVGGASEPPMQGLLTLDTAFELPPSEEDVPLRLELKGRFAITRGQFASDTVQNKVDELSRRGQGQPKNQSVDNVISAFGGTFALDDGVLSLPSLRFSVNGARVDLRGTYRLPTESMAFRGTLRLDAPVSKTVTGVKSFFLKAVDPLFRRNGAGTELPISITGTVQKPAFKVDARRIFRR